MLTSRIVSSRDLEVWQEAMILAEQCYILTNAFPKAEQFGLTSQIRRASVSVASNIAEGHARRTRQAYLNHLHIAAGSQAELETQLELAVRVGIITDSQAVDARESVARVGRILHGLIRAIEQKPQPPIPSPQPPAPSA
jgi:four helix bundle protein